MAKKDFNKENLNTWNELAPSLQEKFIDLENKLSDMDNSVSDDNKSVRITFGYSAPKEPKNNAELWIDERHRIIRAFTEDNWEFTRAAWFGGVKPDVITNSGVAPDNPYKAMPHTDEYFTYDSSKSVPCSWSVNEPSDNGKGYFSRIVFSGAKPISVNLTIDMSGVNNKKADLGYLLAVFGKAYDKNNPSDPSYVGGNGLGSIEHGKGVCWQLNALTIPDNGKVTEEITNGNRIETATPDRSAVASINLNLDTGYYCLFDIDCYNHGLERIMPGSITPGKGKDLQGTTYFGNTVFPYLYDLSANKTTEDVHKHSSYSKIDGKMIIKVTITSTY